MLLGPVRGVLALTWTSERAQRWFLRFCNNFDLGLDVALESEANRIRCVLRADFLHAGEYYQRPLVATDTNARS